MKKLDGKSLDIKEQNIEQLKKLFPEVFSEGKIDFEKLQNELGEFVETENERYNFTWAGKQNAKKIAQTPSTGTLRPSKVDSKNWDTTNNLYIEGDNLEVLKLLQKSYHKQVKMIYIDPPYNTGKDFVYRDNFRDNLKNYLELTNQVDNEGKKLSTNAETNGRYHSDWLNMMYPRLKLARNLLKDDGVIFISIDDNEVANLRKICDEIFGEDNFVAQIIRNTNSAKNQSLFVSVSHEYCLIFSKNIEILKEKHAENKWSVPKNNVDEYVKKVKQLQKEGLSNDEITEELKTLTKYPRFIDFTNYWYFDEKGVYAKDNLGGVTDGNMKPLFNPLTNKEDPIPPGGYRYNSDKLKRLVEENKIHFHTDGSLPRLKRYLHENLTQRPKSIMSDDQRPDYAMMKEFNTPFDNPKQLSFMTRILSLSEKDSLVLDFFSGSATTAHAVMQLNAEDKGNRRYILVQLPEPTDPKSEAYKAGYKNICEIGKERIRRAGEKIIENSELKIDNLDIGFKVFKLDSSNIKEWDSDYDNLEQNLVENIDNIKSDRTSQDLLYEILLKYGLDLTLPIDELTIEGKTVYSIGYGALVVCLDDDITITVVEKIAEFIKEQVVYDKEKKKRHTRVVFKDKSFKNSVVKANAIEVLKQADIDEVVSV